MRFGGAAVVAAVVNAVVFVDDGVPRVVAVVDAPAAVVLLVADVAVAAVRLRCSSTVARALSVSSRSSSLPLSHPPGSRQGSAARNIHASTKLQSNMRPTPAAAGRGMISVAALRMAAAE